MKAAIFYKTDSYIDCDKLNIREQIEEMFEDPDIFEMKEYADNDESMLSLIHTVLGRPTVGVTACNVWENKNCLYAGYFIDITEVQNQLDIEAETKTQTQEATVVSRIKLNNFGSQITSQKVTSNLVIVKKGLDYAINNNNIKTTTSMATIDYHELFDMIESIFVKDGVVIDVSGEMKTYKYVVNPIEHLMVSDPDYEKHYVYHEYEVYTHIMMIVADVRCAGAKQNVKASMLAGCPVNGTVFVALYKKPDYNEKPPFSCLSTDVLDSILRLRQRSPALTVGKEKSDDEYINFEKLLELENINHANKPIIKVTDITGELLNLK